MSRHADAVLWVLSENALFRHYRVMSYPRSTVESSVILNGCADDLVVPDPGLQYGGRGVRGNRIVYAFAAALAGRARRSGRKFQRSGARASVGRH